jgi:hypothetical protein
MNDFEGTLSLRPFELLLIRYSLQLHGIMTDVGFFWFSGLSKRQ